MQNENLPPTCEVRGWIVFAPGFHKGENYTPEMVRRIAPNFERLRGHTIPQASSQFGAIGSTERQAKIGHDTDQELARKLKESKGFLSTGRIIAARPVEGWPDYLEIDEDNIPTTTIGGEINAGRLPGGSVELLERMNDPDDPAKMIEGPILTGISHLGHEQPAVRNWPPALRERAKPRAVFADGSPVPANKAIPSEWLAAMAEVERRMSQEAAAPRQYAFRAFAEYAMPPENQARSHHASESVMADGAAEPAVTKPSQVAAMSAASFSAAKKCMSEGKPDEANKCIAGFADDWAKMSAGDFHKKYGMYADAPPPMGPEAPGGAPGGAAPGGVAPVAPPPPAPGGLAPMSTDAMAAKFAEMEKRMGAYEAEREATKAKEGETKMAAMSAMVEKECEAIWGKAEPTEIDNVIRPLATWTLTGRTFSSESDRMAAFTKIFEPYKAKLTDPRLVSAMEKTKAAPVGANLTAVDGKPPIVPLTPLFNQIVGPGSRLARTHPHLARQARKRAGQQAN